MVRLSWLERVWAAVAPVMPPPMIAMVFGFGFGAVMFELFEERGGGGALG